MDVIVGGGGGFGMLGGEGRLKLGRGDVVYKRTWRPLGERDGVQRGVTLLQGTRSNHGELPRHGKVQRAWVTQF